nr:unnamed protein product [Digitaria exilis]
MSAWIRTISVTVEDGSTRVGPPTVVSARYRCCKNSDLALCVHSRRPPKRLLLLDFGTEDDAHRHRCGRIVQGHVMLLCGGVGVPCHEFLNTVDLSSKLSAMVIDDNNGCSAHAGPQCTQSRHHR